MRGVFEKAVRLARRLIFSVEPWLLVLLLALFGVVGLWGMITYNQTNYFCQRCHKVLGPYRSIYLESKAHEPFKQERFDCVDCHADKDVYVWVGRQVRYWGQLFERITQPQESIAFERYDEDERCLECHYRILETNDLKYFEMPKKLAEIGLRFEHRRHLAFKSFDPDEAERLAQLEAKTELSQEERSEIEFLRKVRDSSCDRCHRRRAAAGGRTTVRKEVNYFSRNLISCATCHPDATVQVHPGTRKLEFPSEKRCRYCHRGRLHGKIMFTLADKRSKDKTSCKVCHPLYQPKEAGQ